jgi:putative peptidoglycan lipid II flippase
MTKLYGKTMIFSRRMNSRQQVLFQSANRFMSGTLISKLSGVLREMIMAFFFGADVYLASFTVAFRISHFFRRFFAESGLGVSFIPFYEAIKLKSQDKGKYFFRDLIFLVFIFLSILTFVVEILYQTLSILDPQWQLIFRLSQILFPCVGLITLFALNQGLLQSEKRFFLPAFSNIFLNICWILAMLVTYNQSRLTAVYVLSFAVLFGFFIQWVFTFVPTFFIIRPDMKEGFFAHLFTYSHEVKKVFKSLGIAIIGVSSLQVNAVIDAVLAKIADPKGPAYLWYSIKLYQLPLALFAISIASALLPTLSQCILKKEWEQFTLHLKASIKKCFYLVVPTTLAFLPIGFYGIEFLYGRGKFDLWTSWQVTYCLYAYGIGLPFASINVILTNAFYARKDYKTPSFYAIQSVLLNLCLNSLFVFYFKMGAVAIALATSLASMYLSFALYWKMRLSLFDWKWVIKIAFISLGAFGSAVLVKPYLDQLEVRTLWVQAVKLFSLSTLFFGIYVLFARRLRPKIEIETTVQ